MLAVALLQNRSPVAFRGGGHRYRITGCCQVQTEKCSLSLALTHTFLSGHGAVRSRSGGGRNEFPNNFFENVIPVSCTAHSLQIHEFPSQKSHRPPAPMSGLHVGILLAADQAGTRQSQKLLAELKCQRLFHQTHYQLSSAAFTILSWLNWNPNTHLLQCTTAL